MCIRDRYNVVMTSDKFIYLFGSLLPSVSLLFIMILRLIPGYQKRIRQIQEARSSVGLGINTVTRGEKIHQGMVLLSTMMTWALEGGVVMADSMKSRGYGCCARRTSFSLYRFEKKDRILLVFMAGLMIVTIWCGICGGADIVYTPVFSGIHMRSVYTCLLYTSLLRVWDRKQKHWLRTVNREAIVSILQKKFLLIFMRDRLIN